jgi:hypothetical protein
MRGTAGNGTRFSLSASGNGIASRARSISRDVGHAGAAAWLDRLTPRVTASISMQYLVRTGTAVPLSKNLVGEILTGDGE